MTRVAMGGTFDVLHRGHRALLATAFEAGDEGVFIGLTSNSMATSSRGREVRPYAERLAALKDFLSSRGWLDRAEIGEISNAYGRALEKGFHALAVTPETAGTAIRINEERVLRKLPPLRVLTAPLVLAEDGRRISATRIRAGEVDAEGRLTRAIRVAVGSSNPVKIEAVRRAITRFWPKAEVRGFVVESRVPEQPFGDDTWVGADERARGALEKWTEADFGVGLEAGLFWVGFLSDHFDVQCAVVVDRGERRTAGQGSGFGYPADVIARVRKENRTVGDVMGELAEMPDIGRKAGAIGFLTRGALDRTGLSEQAILAALIPRVRSEFYLDPIHADLSEKK